ncbi:MAG: triple tyrosine motif-containing protein [Clostridiaceae bacterium]|nr:triple tyrosine motif-containing protein [Clostridiaceae bacterium]
MNEINIKCDQESPQLKNTLINISVENNRAESLTYKFMVGSAGTWKNLKDFCSESSASWVPNEDGKYIIMVQAKAKASKKPFDFVSRMEYVIGEFHIKLLDNIYLEKEVLKVGEKLIVTAEANKSPVMFRFWIREKENWQLIKDYSAENTLNWSVKRPGKQEVMVECRTLNSKKNYDDFRNIAFEVEGNIPMEITNFKCLSTEFLVDSELDFQVEAVYDDSRLILYKFVKINSEGEAICIQEFSTKRLVTYIEKNSGEYKLLCLAKDMYSNNEYDDRAIISYKIKLYNPIIIQSFTTDLSSPQSSDTTIVLKSVVKGGKNLLYRFILDGNYGEDSGYSRNTTFTWNAKKAGKYKLMLWVKDNSYEGNYEDSTTIDFVIDEVSDEPVKIIEVIVDKSGKVLKGESINAKVMATGGTDIRYSFIVKNGAQEVERIEYGTCNWANFTPKEKGKYELEVRVKDKYSKREFDGHSTVLLEVLNFIPASIDYVLFPPREHFIAGELITMDVITRNTSEVLLRYVLTINGHKVEETGFVDNKKYGFTPNYAGVYTVEIYAKSKDSDNEFDFKKETIIKVQDGLPVTNTKITSDRVEATCNKTVNFSVSVQGGKEVLYEFYLWEKNEWNLVQRYSRNKNYSFIPFVPGKYKLLTLCKSQFANCFYEDYDILEFNAEA